MTVFNLSFNPFFSITGSFELLASTKICSFLRWFLPKPFCEVLNSFSTHRRRSGQWTAFWMLAYPLFVPVSILVQLSNRLVLYWMNLREFLNLCFLNVTLLSKRSHTEQTNTVLTVAHCEEAHDFNQAFKTAHYHSFTQHRCCYLHFTWKRFWKAKTLSNWNNTACLTVLMALRNIEIPLIF